jgi:hypothetical protein
VKLSSRITGKSEKVKLEEVFGVSGFSGTRKLVKEKKLNILHLKVDTPNSPFRVVFSEISASIRPPGRLSQPSLSLEADFG